MTNNYKDILIQAYKLIKEKKAVTITQLGKEIFGRESGRAYSPWIVRIFLLYDIVSVDKAGKKLKIVKIRDDPDVDVKFKKLLEDWEKKVEPYV